MNSGPDIVAINATGRATGIRPGVAPVVVQYQGLTLKLNVHVDAIDEIEIKLEAASPSLSVAKSVQLISRYHLDNGMDAGDATTESMWAVSDPSIASIAAKGVITGLREGRTTVSATFRGVTGTAEIWVTPTGCTFTTAPKMIMPDSGLMVSYSTLEVKVTAPSECVWNAKSNSDYWEIRSQPDGPRILGGIGSSSVHLACTGTAFDCRERIASFEIAGTHVTKFNAAR